MHEGSRRAIIAAFLANLGIAAAKLAGFAVTGATSMLAEALHSMADTGNQGLLFLGGRRAAAPPDERHPFGHGAERYFWAFVVAVVLFTFGATFALFEGTEKLLHPHEVESPEWAVAILGVAIALEGWSLRTARREADHVRAGLSWPRFIVETTNPELSVVLLEDTGALVGLLFAISGVTLAWVTGNARFDAAGSLAIGALLAAIAFVLAREMKSLLIGEAAVGPVAREVRSAIAGAPEVARLIHLRTLQLGPDEVLVAAKIELASGVTMATVGDAIDAVEVRVRTAVPAASVIYLEPDRYRTGA